jgi:hypothetical protein
VLCSKVLEREKTILAEKFFAELPLWQFLSKFLGENRFEVAPGGLGRGTEREYDNKETHT